MALNIVEVTWNDGQEVGDNGKSVNLDLLKLWWLPSVGGEGGVVGVDVHDQGVHEILADHHVVGFNVLWVSHKVED